MTKSDDDLPSGMATLAGIDTRVGLLLASDTATSA